MSFECESWDDYTTKKCTGDPIPMGESTPTSARGSYFLETAEGPQFSRQIKIN
jgi:hypothetical protein